MTSKMLEYPYFVRARPEMRSLSLGCFKLGCSHLFHHLILGRI